MKNPQNILFPILTIILPLFLLFSSVRILFNPFFLDYEYGLAKFPPDEFGFTTAERLNLGKKSMDYLFNSNATELSALKFDNGDPLFNEREVSHMSDVKNLVQAALKVWYGIILLIVLLAFVSWRRKWMPQFWRAVSYAGWLTIGLILLILVGVLINFDALFAGFHAIFFKGDTWLFYTSDTLIRLFPEKLWSDAFIFMGVFTLAWAVICGFVGARLAQRQK